MRDIEQNNGRKVSNSDGENPGFRGAATTPVFESSDSLTTAGDQTEAVLVHLHNIQQKKSRSSASSNPAFLGAAMKAIYESSDVSVKRGDQTMVVTQLRGDEPTALLVSARRSPVGVGAPRTAEPSPKSTPSSGFRRPDPFSSRPAVAPKISTAAPAISYPEPISSRVTDEPAIRRSSTYSLSDLVFWIALVFVFLGLAFGISR